MKYTYFNPPKNLTLGLKIKYRRKYMGVTQQELADIVGISRQSLSLYERDKIDPNFFVICCIAKALDLPLDYLAWG